MGKASHNMKSGGKKPRPRVIKSSIQHHETHLDVDFDPQTWEEKPQNFLKFLNLPRGSPEHNQLREIINKKHAKIIAEVVQPLVEKGELPDYFHSDQKALSRAILAVAAPIKWHDSGDTKTNAGLRKIGNTLVDIGMNFSKKAPTRRRPYVSRYKQLLTEVEKNGGAKALPAQIFDYLRIPNSPEYAELIDRIKDPLVLSEAFKIGIVPNIGPGVKFGERIVGNPTVKTKQHRKNLRVFAENLKSAAKSGHKRAKEFHLISDTILENLDTIAPPHKPQKWYENTPGDPRAKITAPRQKGPRSYGAGRKSITSKVVELK